MYYHMRVAGLERDLPICPVNDNLSIAGFIIFGDQELPVACALGLTVAVLEGVLARFSKGTGIDVLLTVGLSMFVCTAAGGVIGLLLPFLARRLGTDPATLSSPLITSVMDLLGVFIYFGFAYLFLGNLTIL